MPTNSQILIDGFISDEFSKQTEYSSKGDYFELLASSRYMAPYDLDDDEIAEGLIGGSRDGGCDAIYIFANNYFLSESRFKTTSIVDQGLKLLFFRLRFQNHSKKTRS